MSFDSALFVKQLEYMCIFKGALPCDLKGDVLKIFPGLHSQSPLMRTSSPLLDGWRRHCTYGENITMGGEIQGRRKQFEAAGAAAKKGTFSTIIKIMNY